MKLNYLISAVLLLCCAQALAQQPADSLVKTGYGVQKKSVVSSSISSVSSDDLGTSSSSSAEDALKGLAAGVNVSSSGSDPGSGAKIRVRGTGTVNNADPLYLVDGMPVEGGIDFLNPSDIESIEVLKDAASAAVYGARAANGVIIVTTRKGTHGSVRVNYDFRTGVSSPWKKRSVLNAAQYNAMLNPGAAASGTDTDWQDLVFNYKAPQSQHEMSLSGADDKVNYYLSLGYNTQDGIVGSQYGRSNYERLTLRSNTSYKLFDATQERDWLNKMDVSLNISYSNIKSTNTSSGSSSGTPLAMALLMPPVLDVYATPEQAARYEELYNYSTDEFGNRTFLGERRIMDAQGRCFLIPGGEYNNLVNPVANLSLPANKSWNEKYVASFTAQLNLLKNLVLRTSLGYDKTYNGMDGYTMLYYMSSVKQTHITKTTKETHQSYVWQVENTLNYDQSFGKHSLSVLLGQSAKESGGNMLGVIVQRLKDLNRPYISYTDALEERGDYYSWGYPVINSRLASYFSRLSYNYDEKYMAEFTFRVDGSSRFGPANHWAGFPSLSLGWNLAREKFMENTSSWLSLAKLRASWGQNGNENIGDYLFAAVTRDNGNYIFGEDEKIQTGTYQRGLSAPDLKWETTTQTDLGLDLGFFDGDLNFTFDYYDKLTEGILMEINIPLHAGDVNPIANVGKMRNSGLEFEAGYGHAFRDFTFHISANAAYLKNTMVDYGNDSGWANLVSKQGLGTITRAENGKPFPFFYGYRTDGVFQNEQEIASYVDKNGKQIMPDAVPGDVRFVDIDGNGSIDSDDRTYIGKGSPDWLWGLNLQMNYKGFDFSMLLQGSLGNDIFDASVDFTKDKANLPSYFLDCWKGEGTSNRFPRYVIGDNVNWQSSDLFVYDGSFARLRNVQLGYTLPLILSRKLMLNKLRLYVAAENLLTLTSYHGFDPEITSEGVELGIDYGATPHTRTFLFGVNLSFGGR